MEDPSWACGSVDPSRQTSRYSVFLRDVRRRTPIAGTVLRKSGYFAGLKIAEAEKAGFESRSVAADAPVSTYFYSVLIMI